MQYELKKKYESFILLAEMEEFETTAVFYVR